MEDTRACDITDMVGGVEVLHSLVDEESHTLYAVNPCRLDGVYFRGLEVYGDHGEWCDACIWDIILSVAFYRDV